MRIQYILERIFTGKNVKFLEGSIESGPKMGNKIVIVEDLDTKKKYVLKESTINFIRFKKWIGKNAVADYEPMWKTIHTNVGDLPLIRISTEVEIEVEGHRNYKDNQYDKIGELDL